MIADLHSPSIPSAFARFFLKTREIVRPGIQLVAQMHHLHSLGQGFIFPAALSGLASDILPMR
jgi:hypothetical protein